VTDLLVPDVSEWQGTIDWAALVGGSYPAVIIRAYNGYRADEQWTRNREQAHAHGVRALGIYAYLVADRPITNQAAEFAALVGQLRPGEWPIVDYEAAGLTPADAQQWASAVVGALHGSQPWLYASEYVYRTEHLGEQTSIPSVRTWIAAYGPTEPSEPHELWQYTDHRTVPGVSTPVDCSTFHGTVEQLLAAVSPPPRPTPGPTTHPTYPYPAGIHPGGTSPSARPLQQALKRAGWMDPSVVESDHYGSKTQESVAGFNAKHHLNNSGQAYDPAIGPHGWALLMTFAYGSR
jgi:GH25 family lysozyme M1 (1,4-beta-N-acetylmuramidase)